MNIKKIKIFNSDIILGRYPKDIDQAFANRLAQVLFDIYADDTMTIVIGRDTREQNFELEKTLTQAFLALGANVFLLCVTCSAAVSFATQAYKATFGVYLTAGTKPKQYVGFKIFNGNGYKISDEQLSKVIYQFKHLSAFSPKHQVGKIYIKPYFNDEFASYLKQFSTIPSHHSIKVLADLTCGAGEEIYEELCAHLGIVPFLAAGGVDGNFINRSYHKALQSNKQTFCVTSFGKTTTKNNFFDFKVVFSGDGDKMLLFDKQGKKVANELIFALFALANEGKVVTNLFTNNSVFEFLQKKQIDVVIVNDVSEKQLVNTMLYHHSLLGGDHFGNLVFLPHGKTSCGFLTLVRLLSLWCANPTLVQEVLSLPLVPSEEKFFKTKANFNMEQWKMFMTDCEVLVGENGKILSRRDKQVGWVSLFVESADEGLMKSIFVLAEQFFA